MSRSKPAPLTWFTATLVVGVLVATACRQTMDQQPSYRPFQPAAQFVDGTSARTAPADTVARGQLRGDPAFFTGLVNGQEVDQMPFPATREVLERGQQRFNIYCVPCHGFAADGNGEVVQRGFTRPPSFHTDRLRQAPIGHFFVVMSNGFGAMPSYAAQIPPPDRWDIAAYIRALQLSQNATIDDVPPDQRTALQVQP
jgi:mono/diheme cytochrome c family protein